MRQRRPKQIGVIWIPQGLFSCVLGGNERASCILSANPYWKLWPVAFGSCMFTSKTNKGWWSMLESAWPKLIWNECMSSVSMTHYGRHSWKMQMYDWWTTKNDSGCCFFPFLILCAYAYGPHLYMSYICAMFLTVSTFQENCICCLWSNISTIMLSCDALLPCYTAQNLSLYLKGFFKLIEENNVTMFKMSQTNLMIASSKNPQFDLFSFTLFLLNTYCTAKPPFKLI